MTGVGLARLSLCAVKLNVVQTMEIVLRHRVLDRLDWGLWSWGSCFREEWRFAFLASFRVSPTLNPKPGPKPYTLP